MEEITIQKPESDVLVQDDSTTSIASRVVLYNDDWHTFDEVITQLIKATGCSFEQARSFAFDVHVRGKSIVFNGSIKDCLRVTSILEEIALNTEIIT